MKLDVLGLLGACSYALDCVEAELVHVTSRHAKRVAYMSVCTAETLGVHGNALQDLAACALLHDNALTQYIRRNSTETPNRWICCRRSRIWGFTALRARRISEICRSAPTSAE